MFPWILKQQPQHPRLACCRSVHILRAGVRAIHPGVETLWPAVANCPQAAGTLPQESICHIRGENPVGTAYGNWQRTPPTRYYPKGKHYPGSDRFLKKSQATGKSLVITWSLDVRPCFSYKTVSMLNVVIFSLISLVLCHRFFSSLSPPSFHICYSFIFIVLPFLFPSVVSSLALICLCLCRIYSRPCVISFNFWIYCLRIFIISSDDPPHFFFAVTLCGL
jgi:hypothetical protein